MNVHPFLKGDSNFFFFILPLGFANACSLLENFSQVSDVVYSLLVLLPSFLEELFPRVENKRKNYLVNLFQISIK